MTYPYEKKTQLNLDFSQVLKEVVVNWGKGPSISKEEYNNLGEMILYKLNQNRKAVAEVIIRDEFVSQYILKLTLEEIKMEFTEDITINATLLHIIDEYGNKIRFSYKKGRPLGLKELFHK